MSTPLKGDTMNYKIQATRSPTHAVIMVETTASRNNKGAGGSKGERIAGENRGGGRWRG